MNNRVHARTVTYISLLRRYIYCANVTADVMERVNDVANVIIPVIDCQQ